MTTDQLIEATRARRKLAGLNVAFIREDGIADEWSFATAQRRDAFIAKVRAAGRKADIATVGA